MFYAGARERMFLKIFLRMKLLLYKASLKNCFIVKLLAFIKKFGNMLERG